MTPEELDKLGGPLCCGVHEALVSRLIAERDVLLAALIEMVHDNRPGMGAEGRALAAIRLAEGKPE